MNHPVFVVTVPFVIQEEFLYKTEFEYYVKDCLALKPRSQVRPCPTFFKVARIPTVLAHK